MQATSPGADPLAILPPELVLRILEFASVSDIASLTAVSKAWHQFIDLTHQDAIYSLRSKVGGALSDTPTFSKWFDHTASWKNLCERQTLLARNWASPHPVSRELLIQIGNDPVWRFRADLKRRFIISTSHAGGLNVTDLDTGRILWRLPSTLDSDGEDAVRPYAHLEYQDGMAVFDREGDAVEVWQADLEGAARGEFRRIAVLEHDCQTRGFQLSYGTLCVVSSQGWGFVYDMTQRPPRLTRRMEIEHGAVGHLDQSRDAVIYSIGSWGYHVYDKASGVYLGALHPSHCTEEYHIRPPPAPTSSDSLSSRMMDAARGISPPKTRLVPLEIERGPLPPPEDPDHVRNAEQDEWGAGMEDGDLFVGVSRAGRVFVCSDWRKALRVPSSLAECSAIIECESDGSTFDLGGWLSVRNHRLMFEIQDRIYVVALDDHNRIQDPDHHPPARASYSLSTCSTPQLAVPVSFMALYDDAIMTTYTTLGQRQQSPGTTPQTQQPPGNEGRPTRIFPTKTVRIISLAPDNPGSGSDSTAQERLRPRRLPSSSAEDTERSRTLLQLLSALRDQYAEAEAYRLEDGASE